jgi:hypothetical protein
MTREEFTAFTEGAIEDALQLAEERVGKQISRNIAFKWLGSEEDPIRDGIVEAIVGRVYQDDEHIYPCVDIGVMDLLDDGSPVIMAAVAGFAPRPFCKNWTGRDGPYVRILGNAFVLKALGQEYHEGKFIGFSLPDMARLDES